jgi:ribosome biogenesis GTPase / thiamine phosphate phosphatase
LPKKGPREKDLTERYLSGGFDEDRVDARQQFNRRSKFHQQNKTAKTAGERAAVDESLPRGFVTQVFSRYLQVRDEAGVERRCIARKTLARTHESQIVVGDRVRFSPLVEPGQDVEGTIEFLEPRTTLLTRADSFKAIEQHPIVVNAERMLIVASLWAPFARWGLIDRMLVAAAAGGLEPVVCLNKVDLADESDKSRGQAILAEAALSHYESLGVRSLRTSVRRGQGIDELRRELIGRHTVLAGHSGVGKSSLVHAADGSIDLRIGEVSAIHLKGKHTTTSAKYYDLAGGGAVIDTPGVKLFGLWNVTAESLSDHFPDVEAGTAPPWREESYRRMLESLRVPRR